jgi:RNA polymerase sigma-70 factor (ECF subfamily)
MAIESATPAREFSCDEAQSESYFIARLTIGDQTAAEALFEMHVDVIFNHARRISRNETDAEDIVSAVFLEMWRKRETIRGFRGSIRPWLLLTANYVNANRSRSIRRLSDFVQRGIVSDVVPDHAETVARQDEVRQQLTAVVTTFQQLPKLDQDIVTLCLVEELSYAETAEILGVSHSVVRNRLSRARAKLSDSAKKVPEENL